MFNGLYVRVVVREITMMGKIVIIVTAHIKKFAILPQSERGGIELVDIGVLLGGSLLVAIVVIAVYVLFLLFRGGLHG